MIAALPMYLRAETRPAHDELWSRTRDALRARGVDAPDALGHNAPLDETWLSPDLLLGQTCSLPYRTRLLGKVTVIGAGDYGLSDTPPGFYRSALVVHAQDPRNALADFIHGRLAINGADSQSGWCAPFLHARARGLRFHQTLTTGAHRESARAVAEGRADIAALDAVTWRLIGQHDSFAAKLRVLDWTDPTPGLPFITAVANDPAPIRAALNAALSALPAPHATALGLRAVVPLPQDAYTTLPQPDPPPTRANAPKTGKNTVFP